jgi:hypothetical protein
VLRLLQLPPGCKIKVKAIGDALEALFGYYMETSAWTNARHSDLYRAAYLCGLSTQASMRTVRRATPATTALLKMCYVAMAATETDYSAGSATIKGI